MRLPIRYASLLLGAVAIAVLIAGCGGDVVAVNGPGAFAVSQPPEAGESGVITGQIISLRDGEPVPGVVVVIGAAMAISDTEGSFTIDGVQPGEHWLTVTGDLAIIGGPILVEVEAETADLGRIVVDAVATLPPAEPAI